MLVPEVNSDIVGCQKRVILLQKGKLKVEMTHRTQAAPLPQPGSTNTLLTYYRFTQSFHKGKTSYPFYFYPLHFISPKYLETILNSPFSSSLLFSISLSPDTTKSSWANADLSNSPKQRLPWGDHFLFLLPDFLLLFYLQSACIPLCCQDTTTSTWCCLWGNSRAIETKRDLLSLG